MSSSAPPYERERLGNGSKTKKLLYSKLISGEFNGQKRLLKFKKRIRCSVHKKRIVFEIAGIQ